MNTLPSHGRISCNKCFAGRQVVFDETKLTDADWRITANPLAWGSPNAEIVVLGFSKGPTQAGAICNMAHDEIAYKSSRSNMAKILSHIGVLTLPAGSKPAEIVSESIANRHGRFHFGSLIRCTVERYDQAKSEWMGTGGGMLDRFVATPFGKQIAQNCTERFLSALPLQTKLVVMFGLGQKLNYVREAYTLISGVIGGEWKYINDVAYTDGRIVVVHVEHFASQGNWIPFWMSENRHPRSRYAQLARQAVKQSDVMPPLLTCTVDVPLKIQPLSPEVVPHKEITSEDTANESLTIFDLAEKVGYRVLSENKKLAELRSPADQSIYVLKERSSLNHIVVMVHPDFSKEELTGISGVDEVSPTYRLHSNMVRFPKMLNRGKNEITYGRQLVFSSIGNFEQFLRTFLFLSVKSKNEVA